VTAPLRTPGPSIEDLEAEAVHARGRLALYKRRVYLGRGDCRRLAELQRELAGSEARLRGARQTAAPDA
jgi:hypothetical protein